MEDLRLQKQEYLRREILDAGYDPAQFQYFCEYNNPSAGDNIDDWTLEDLKQMVSSFIAQQNQGNEVENKSQSVSRSGSFFEPVQEQPRIIPTVQITQEQIYQVPKPKAVPAPVQQIVARDTSYFDDKLNQYIKKQSQEQIAINNQIQNTSATLYDQKKIEGFVIKKNIVGNVQAPTAVNEKQQGTSQTNVLNIPEFNGLMQCKSLEKTKIAAFFLENPGGIIKVAIESNEKKEINLLQSYIQYKIITTPLDWLVYRRYSDFGWLRATLIKLYPGHLIPTLPKKSVLKKTDQYYLGKRQKVLEDFLDKIVSSPFLKCTPVVNDFLSLTEEAQFKARVKDYDGRQAILKIQDCSSLTGEVQVISDSKIKDFNVIFAEYVNAIDEPYKKVKNYSKQLFLDLDNLSSTLIKLSEAFSELSKNTNIFNRAFEKVFDFSLKPLEEIYISLNNFTDKWGKTIINQMQVVKDHFYEQFRINKKQVDVFKEFAKQRTSQTAFFYDQQKKLVEKKEKVFTSNDLSKWDLVPGCNKTPQQLQGNRQEALPLILNTDTENVNHFGYQVVYINQLYMSDSVYLLQRQQFNYANKFIKCTQQFAESLSIQHQSLAETLTNLSRVSGQEVLTLNPKHKK